MSMRDRNRPPLLRPENKAKAELVCDPERAERLTRAHIERTGRLMAGYAEDSTRPDEHPLPKEGEG
jgi:hypothetical protein